MRKISHSTLLWGEEEKENGGRHSPFLLSRRRPSAEKSLRLGAKGTEEQGFAGIRAPSPRRPDAEKSPRLGAKGTEEQGFAGVRAPSPRRPSAEKARGLGAKGTKEQGFAGVRAPSPRRPPAGICRPSAQSPAAPQKTIKKRATSVARSWCAIRGSNPGHPD